MKQYGIWECKKCGRCCKNQPGGIDLLPEEIKYFPKRSYKKHMGYGKTKSDITVTMYKLISKRCPLYDEKVGCTIYENRPRVCRSYPVTSAIRGTGIDVGCSNSPRDGNKKMVSEELMNMAIENDKITIRLCKEVIESGSKIWVSRNFKWKLFNKEKRLKELVSKLINT